MSVAMDEGGAGSRKERMLIGGAWVDSAGGGELAVENPGNRATIAHIPRGGEEDVDRAVTAAAEAFATWSKTVPRDRGFTKQLFKVTPCPSIFAIPFSIPLAMSFVCSLV